MAELSPAERVREFRQRLRDLRTDAGEPSAVRMIDALAGTGLRMSKATISEFANDKRPLVLPQSDFVAAYVTACLTHRGTAPDEIEREVRDWLSSWSEIAMALGISFRAAATTSAEPVDDPPPAPPEPAEPAAPPLHRRRRRVLAAVVLPVLAVAAVLLIFGRPHATKPLFVKAPIGAPDPGERGVHGCPARQAVVNNDLGAPIGSVLLEECADDIRLTWNDHLADGYCVYVQLDWPDGSADRTDRACPAGEIEQRVLRKRAAGYTGTLIAVNVEKAPN